MLPYLGRIGLVMRVSHRKMVSPHYRGGMTGVFAMKRNDSVRKVVDLGKASRETKGGTIGVPDFLGQYAPLGLTKD
jgi:hypothetical protein